MPFKRNVQRYITGKGKRLLCYDPRSPTDITEYVRETSRFDDFSVVRLHQSPNDDNLVVRKRGGMGWDGMGRAAPRGGLGPGRLGLALGGILILCGFTTPSLSWRKINT